MKVNKKQQKAFRLLVTDKKSKYIAYGGAAGSGKSWLGCLWLFFMGYSFAKTRWFVGRRDMKSSRQSIYVTFQKVADAHNFHDYKFNDDGIKFGNGSEIILLDLQYMPFKDPMFERLGSKEFTGGWIEEAGEVMELAFDVLKSRVGRHLNDYYKIPPKILITCNPRKNWLYTTFYRPKRDGLIGESSDNQEYEFIQALYTDNPFLPEEYIENLESITDPVTRARLLLGQWEYENDENSLFNDFDALRDMFTNEHVQPVGAHTGSADIATKGRDRFIGFSSIGNVFKKEFNIGYSGGREIEKTLRDMMIRCNIPRSMMVVDADGVGSFIESYLQGIKEFHGGGKPKDSRYQNLKTECYFKLADMVRRRTIRVVGLSPQEQEQLIEELQAVKQVHIDADTQKIAINSKEEQKALLGRSPDIADALMMAMFFRAGVRAQGETSINTIKLAI